jgi:hypothetical protein
VCGEISLTAIESHLTSDDLLIHFQDCEIDSRGDELGVRERLKDLIPRELFQRDGDRPEERLTQDNGQLKDSEEVIIHSEGWEEKEDDSEEDDSTEEL